MEPALRKAEDELKQQLDAALKMNAKLRQQVEEARTRAHEANERFAVSQRKELELQQHALRDTKQRYEFELERLRDNYEQKLRQKDREKTASKDQNPALIGLEAHYQQKLQEQEHSWHQREQGYRKKIDELQSYQQQMTRIELEVRTETERLREELDRKEVELSLQSIRIGPREGETETRDIGWEGPEDLGDVRQLQTEVGLKDVEIEDLRDQMKKKDERIAALNQVIQTNTKTAKRGLRSGDIDVYTEQVTRLTEQLSEYDTADKEQKKELAKLRQKVKRFGEIEQQLQTAAIQMSQYEADNRSLRAKMAAVDLKIASGGGVDDSQTAQLERELQRLRPLEGEVQRQNAELERSKHYYHMAKDFQLQISALKHEIQQRAQTFLELESQKPTVDSIAVQELTVTLAQVRQEMASKDREIARLKREKEREKHTWETELQRLRPLEGEVQRLNAQLEKSKHYHHMAKDFQLQISALKHEIQQRAQTIVELESQRPMASVPERTEAEMQFLRQQLSRKEEEIAQLRSEVVGSAGGDVGHLRRQSEVAELQKQLHTKNQEIAHCQLRASEKATVDSICVQELAGTLAQVRHETALKDREIARLKTEKERLESSASDKTSGDVQSHQVKELHRLLKEKDDELSRLKREKERENHELKDEVEARKQEQENLQGDCVRLQQQLQRQEEEATQQLQLLQQRLDAALAEVQHLQHSPQTAPKSHTLWNIPRQEVQIGSEIARGAWGTVYNGNFQGQSVAVKSLHPGLLHEHTIERLRREVQIMAQVRHPNLLRFIGAVFDSQVSHQHPPLIVVELLDVDLRMAYQTKRLQGSSKIPIFRDIAYALHCLHEHHEPIIHRDVSAPNVLLEALPNGMWRAKVSDFGSANLARLAKTMGEGAIIYTAPESFPQAHEFSSRPPPQTTKIDVFSYGVLLCEVITSQLPDPERFWIMLQQVEKQWPLMHQLIISCRKRNADERPTMAEILDQLNALPRPKPN